MCVKALVSIWDFMLALQRLTIEKGECKHYKTLVKRNVLAWVIITQLLLLF